jgi:hypothetical protein
LEPDRFVDEGDFVLVSMLALNGTSSLSFDVNGTEPKVAESGSNKMCEQLKLAEGGEGQQQQCRTHKNGRTEETDTRREVKGERQAPGQGTGEGIGAAVPVRCGMKNGNGEWPDEGDVFFCYSFSQNPLGRPDVPFQVVVGAEVRTPAETR